MKTGGVQTIALANGEYVALKRPLAPAAAGGGENAPSVLLLRSRTERLRFLDAIHTGLGVVAMIAVLAATILSYAVARTITRPLATITDVMREMSATGDLTRKIALSRAASWEDEDAKLLAATFNTLTDSIARFQREAAQRERLSALGRLSTVIAHEIRNPLMIIKASLRTLAAERVSRDDMQAGADRRRRRGRAAQPRRQRRARFRAADPVRLRAGRRQCAVRRCGAGDAERAPGYACRVSNQIRPSRPL